ncbi:LysM peptidoglycan-binding domain-containing protein [Parvibaculum sp.]|uniref:LysM peptidoglycan-binding domain-containing protein n=1 Tax=Parvibaculum sp. TaxID=2024848 RepID=UPI0027315954|nr:Ig-like domain-containing protein [Parvibaculum sp.]MDP1627682.1 LysM peptidoglycan-binding domain-containing protein [Parvibaculum sp.]MDP2150680.1 LysM peptidoglycan-binding domain-containing protein [Parvibaculum sp.]MDP3329688.1 LysM peptidoglycan-binding domain-containing protein [Parvibaculum sp.]
MKIGAIVGAFVVALILLVGGYWFFFRGDTGPAPAEIVSESATPADAGAADEAADPSIPTFDIVRVERDGSALAAGRSLPGARIQLKANGEVVAETTADERGEWVAVLEEPLKPGTIELRLTASNPDGSVKDSLQVVTVNVPEDTSKPALVVRSEPGKASTVLQGPGVPADAGSLVLETVDYDEKGNVIVSGRADPGSKVRVYVGGDPVGEATANESGRWELRPETDIAPGQYALRVDQIDEEGRVVGRVEVPFERGEAAAVLAALRDGKVVIQPGNNLWNIARGLYGSGFSYTVIYEANKSQIRDPNLIYPGQVFETPGLDR